MRPPPNFAALVALADRLGMEHVSCAEKQLQIAEAAVSAALGKLLPLIGAPAAQSVAVCREARDQIQRLSSTLHQLRDLVAMLSEQDPTVSEDFVLSQSERVP